MAIYTNSWCLHVYVIASVFANAFCCPSGWMTHGSTCYHFSHDTENWIGALQFCRELKGQLVEINDSSENTFIEAQVKLRSNSFWIALSDVEEESTWMWMNSREQLKTSSFNDWIVGQPDNAGADENCGCIYSPGNYHWNDYPCHRNLHYICEKADENDTQNGGRSDNLCYVKNIYSRYSEKFLDLKYFPWKENGVWADLYLSSDGRYGYTLCCPSGWLTHGSTCYHFSHDTESWIGALHFCREYGGELVEIQDAVENAYIKAQVKLQNKNFWTALSDAEEEGTWVWMNSKTSLSTTGFSDWAPGEPNNLARNENCGCFYLTPYFKWDDCTCHSNLNYICEKPDGSGEIVG